MTEEIVVNLVSEEDEDEAVTDVDKERKKRRKRKRKRSPSKEKRKRLDQEQALLHFAEAKQFWDNQKIMEDKRNEKKRKPTQ